MQVALSTVKLWAGHHGWQERIRERDAVVARQAADQALHSSVEEQSRNRKIVQLALVRLAKAIANGQVKMQLGDLDRLIRLQAFLDGQEDLRLEDRTPEQIAAFIDTLLSSLSTAELNDVLTALDRRQQAAQNPASTPPPSPPPPVQKTVPDCTGN
jgi:hypothetical protein